MRSRTILRASLCVVLAACGLCVPAPRTLAQPRIAIVGSGSNVPINLYTAWTEEFNKKNSGITVRYLSMSTVEGIRQITEGSGDFAAGEIPLTDGADARCQGFRGADSNCAGGNRSCLQVAG